MIKRMLLSREEPEVEDRCWTAVEGCYWGVQGEKSEAWLSFMGDSRSSDPSTRSNGDTDSSCELRNVKRLRGWMSRQVRRRDSGMAMPCSVSRRTAFLFDVESRQSACSIGSWPSHHLPTFYGSQCLDDRPDGFSSSGSVLGDNEARHAPRSYSRLAISSPRSSQIHSQERFHQYAVRHTDE